MATTPLNASSDRAGKAHPVLEDISVVIPTLGRPILEECLSWSVLGSVWPAHLIVVDQSASSQVATWVQNLQSLGFNAQHIPSEKRGRSAGINTGLAHVRTRFVAITDDDCFVDHEWLQNIGLHLHRSPDAIITGRVEPASDGELPFCIVTSLTPKIYYRPELRAQPLIGGNMAVSMQNVAKIGSFDEHPSLHSAEDSDWGYRALRLGIPIVYAPEIVVRHFSWRKDDERRVRYRQYSRSQGGFYGKYLLSGDWMIGLQAVRDLVRGPIRWVRGSLTGDQDMIASGRADTLDLLPGIIEGLQRRKI